MIPSRTSRPRRARYAVAALATAVVLVAGFVACGGSDDPDDAVEAPSGKAADGGQGSEREVEVYFTAGEQFKPVERKVTAGGTAPEQAARALLEGPNGTDANTLIPDGTELEELEVDEDGEAVVELSDEFLSGIPATPRERSLAQEEKVTARLSQLTYTLTSTAEVDSVKVRSGGVTVRSAARNSSGGVVPATERERGDFSEPPSVPRVPKVRGGTGARAQGTRSLQENLAKLGYLPRSGVDGIAGYQTEQAVMAFQAWEGLVRDGVAGPSTRAALSTARRPKPKAKNPRHFMEVHLDKGVLLLVKDRRTVRAVHVSGGAPATSTPTGRYRIFRKELMSWSYPFSTWLPYASYFNNGIAFHEYPEVPPYPASHGCVRVPTPDAKRVYEFARMNTVVVVRS